jgi:hypothetical protein
MAREERTILCEEGRNNACHVSKKKTRVPFCALRFRVSPQSPLPTVGRDEHMRAGKHLLPLFSFVALLPCPLCLRVSLPSLPFPFPFPFGVLSVGSLCRVPAPLKLLCSLLPKAKGTATDAAGTRKPARTEHTSGQTSAPHFSCRSSVLSSWPTRPLLLPPSTRRRRRSRPPFTRSPHTPMRTPRTGRRNITRNHLQLLK